MSSYIVISPAAGMYVSILYYYTIIHNYLEYILQLILKTLQTLLRFPILELIHLLYLI